jgi:preprotein translocase subunit YajC
MGAKGSFPNIIYSFFFLFLMKKREKRKKKKRKEKFSYLGSISSHKYRAGIQQS